MEDGIALVYTVRNVDDGQTVTIQGDGVFCIGLTLDEKLSCRSQHATLAKSKSSQQRDDDDIAVPLIMLTVWRTSGVTVSPASRDLKCILNGDSLNMEAHFIPGSQIEVGDKILELQDGLTVRPAKRHLPPTPGVPIHPVAPPKPQRASILAAGQDSVSKTNGSHDILREWCLQQLPSSEQELAQQTKDSNQLANLVAGFLTRHINVHTDVVVTKDLTDCIFRMTQEVAHHRSNILRHFLSLVIAEVNDTHGENIDNTHHAKVASLLVEILQQFLDPSYIVLLCLQLLRSLSHIPGNISTLVVNNTSAAVLGSMAVYKDDEQIQSHCLDIIAKLATYTPALLEKPPLRESSIDLITIAIKLHLRNLRVIQASIRTLANLASTLHLLAFTTMKASPTSDLQTYANMVMTVLDYLYSQTLELVQKALANFSNDLTVKTDGRRFLFEYAKIEQLKNQHLVWTQLFQDNLEKQAQVTPADESHQSHDQSRTPSPFEDTDETVAFGILKKSRSYENLRNPVRRVSFVNGSDQQYSSSGSSSPIDTSFESEQMADPDIQAVPQSDTNLPADTGISLGYKDDTKIDSLINSSVPTVDDNQCNELDVAALSVAEFSGENSMITSTEPTCNSANQPELSNSLVDICNGDLHLQNGATDSHVPAPEQLTASHHSMVPVDISDFRYSSADIFYMKQLLILQITCHICSAAVKPLDLPALKLIDLPLCQLLKRAGIPTAVWQFASSQFDESCRLMDIDPAAVISIIDAVRYKVLLFELVKKDLQMLVQSMTPKVHDKILKVTQEVLEFVMDDSVLAPVFSDHQYLNELQQELNIVQTTFPQPTPPVLDGLKTLIASMVQQTQHT